MQIQGHGMTIAPSKNRKGRKRKSGRREPNGQMQRVPVDYRAMAAQNPDRRGVAVALRSSELAGSVLGRLNLNKRITEPEREAGSRYSVIVGAYRAMIGVPAHLAGAGGGYGCNPLLCLNSTKAMSVCICKGRKDRYDAAYCSIRTHAAHMAVNAVAIHDQDISPDQLVHLREGLACLARHFGLTGRRRA